MERNFKTALEQLRSDKIKSLGFLCYNLYVDGAMKFPEMGETADDIGKILNHMTDVRKSNPGADYLQKQEDVLTEKLTDLGCICYNLYIDRKLFNNKVLSLCDNIASISSEIANGLTIVRQDDYEAESVMEPPIPEYRKETEYKKESEYKMAAEHESMTESDLKAKYPYGMEPIPAGFKKCRCSYRNRHEAKFCAKCGAKLP